MKTLRSLVVAAAVVAVSGAAQAALVSLGDGTVKDTNTNLIWLQDWNVNGLHDWSTQNNWAEGHSFAGSSDWALPSIDEYQALLIAYGNLTQVAEFTNVQYDYWSGTVYPQVPGDAFYFWADNGAAYADSQTLAFSAVAVRPGDVATSVPEPQTLALALLALAATVVARKRRPA